MRTNLFGNVLEHLSKTIWERAILGSEAYNCHCCYHWPWCWHNSTITLAVILISTYQYNWHSLMIDCIHNTKCHNVNQGLCMNHYTEQLVHPLLLSYLLRPPSFFLQKVLSPFLADVFSALWSCLSFPVKQAVGLIILSMCLVFVF